ncbi:MAG: 3-deoxy-8-phosphooctulonate synthase [Chitinophagales bacterium]|nr:3-deoxy-8-phosphooctulonate synthase [Bacteroidota bacterium]MBP7399747.1 3-deoxy-8-phosphooctulonate synthase [Chitinophagales bacterium]MBK8486656.1 3-deoxy-8-phosphooctulonate synthase [Bacteroidota bacterium]MBK8683439.1 3-deoxy-8-phosphooctulonate synthase [Bacteroidota bacterium]MBP7399816.1 3-deoxy-8-phosphooctulonate synthase [Chitinophagales bacterium]
MIFKTSQHQVSIAQNFIVGSGNPLLIAGPCVIENEMLCLTVAKAMKEIAASTGFQYVFKASFDKANRTSANSFRGDGIAKGLEVLQKIKDTVGVPVLTDIHLPDQAAIVATVVDVLQIPAFLCRQTDLLLAAGETGKAVNIKKGQFMAPEDMQYAAEKVRTAGNLNVMLTERGSSFGYHNLVVDMRSLPVMRQYAPIIFDVTHSVQMPGGAGGSSSGRREFAPYLAKAAAAAGVDGFFIETHPNPEKALSDGPNMIPLNEMEKLLSQLKRIMEAAKDE